jgi:site-specific DNA-methyltransferase (adenine-specific)/modification methylase
MIEASDIRQPEAAVTGERKGCSLDSLVVLPRPYYEQDGITIYCGDNRQLLPLVEPCDLLLTDPPYGIGFASQPTTGQRQRKMKAVQWDDEPADEWVLMLARKLCRMQIIFGGNYYALPVSRCWLSWYKPDAPPSMGNVEYAWTNLDKNSRQISQSIAATNGERVGHPTQKPLRVINWAMQYAGESRTVLDPWMGSGTTLVAAKLAGLRAVGIEINRSYCDAAVRRLSQGVLWQHNDEN